jgi:hypothetical protein
MNIKNYFNNHEGDNYEYKKKFYTKQERGSQFIYSTSTSTPNFEGIKNIITNNSLETVDFANKMFKRSTKNGQVIYRRLGKKASSVFGNFSCNPFDHMSGEWSIEENKCVVGFVHASQCYQPYNQSAFPGDYQDDYQTKVCVLLVFLDKDGGDKKMASTGQFPNLREASPVSWPSQVNYTQRSIYTYMDETFKNQLVSGNLNYVGHIAVSAYIHQNDYLSRALDGSSPVPHATLDQTVLNMVYDMFKNTPDGQVSPGTGDLSYLSPSTWNGAGTGLWQHSQLNSAHDISIFKEIWHNADHYSYGRFCMDEMNSLNTTPNKTNGPWIPQDPSAIIARSHGVYRSAGSIESHKLIFDNFEKPDNVFEQGLVWNDMNYTIPRWTQVNEHGATSRLDTIMSGQTAKFIFPIKQNS